jgi:hypothetical protein
MSTAPGAGYTFVDAIDHAYTRHGIPNGRTQFIRAGWAGTALLTVPQLAVIGLRAAGQTVPARFFPLAVLLVGITIMYFTAGRVLPRTPDITERPPRWYLLPLLGMWVFQGGAFAADTNTASIIIILLFAPCVWGVLLTFHTNAVTALRYKVSDELRAHGATAQDAPALVRAWLAQPFPPYRAILLIRVGYALENATDPDTWEVSDEDLAAVAYVQDNLR